MRNYSELNLNNFLNGQINQMKREIQNEEENNLTIGTIFFIPKKKGQ